MFRPRLSSRLIFVRVCFLEPTDAAAVHQDAPGVTLAVQEAPLPDGPQDRPAHQVYSTAVG